MNETMLSYVLDDLEHALKMLDKQRVTKWEREYVQRLIQDSIKTVKDVMKKKS